MRLAHRCQVRIQQWNDEAYSDTTVTMFVCYCHEHECPYKFSHQDQPLTHEAAAQHTHRMNRALEGLRL